MGGHRAQGAGGPDRPAGQDIGRVVDAQVEAQTRAGKTVSTSFTRTFTIQNVTSFPDRFRPRVTASIGNVTNIDRAYVRVCALVYDDKENIVGAGASLVSSIPANSQRASTTDLDISSGAVRIEVYATQEEVP